MGTKINFSIQAEQTGMGLIKTGNLEPQDYTKYQDVLAKAERFDSTNVRGRIRLNNKNFYNYQKYYGQLSPDQRNRNFAYFHQIQAVETILKLPFGGLLADQVGMGKTIEAGMIICELAYRDEWRVLLITLSNDDLIRNWHDEMFEKFGMNLAIVSSAKSGGIKDVFKHLCNYQKTGKVEDNEGKDYEVINKIKYPYHGVIVPFGDLVDPEFIKMVDEYNVKNSKRPFHVDLIVVDESHRYTSTDSASDDNKINALHKLQIKQTVNYNGEERQEKQGRILLLTATPIKNDLKELLELMRIINPKYTEADFRKELGLRENDPFDLTTVLQKPSGVKRWWEWFAKFGERHTRATTIYKEKVRQDGSVWNNDGVKWQKKNSHSFYFNDNDISPVRTYFEDPISNTDIKCVDGTLVPGREKENSVLKGNRTSEVITYQSIIPNFDMERFARFMKIISFIKKEISFEDLKDEEYDENKEGFTYEDLEKEFNKKDYDTWRNMDVVYYDLDPALKPIYENVIVRFLRFMHLRGNNSSFFDEFFKFVIDKIPNIQGDNENKTGIKKIKDHENFALLLCSRNMFLELEKMLKLGTIINSNKHSNEKIIIFCHDDIQRRMLVAYSFLWDFSSRYADNEKVARVGRMKENDINYVSFSNVVSIAYTTDAEGLNLQAYHTMINYSIVLSPLHMEQRIGRIDRIGQTHEMDVYFFASCQDVEGYILRFFEYELQLFSNWSGDTTASTYIDASDDGEDIKVEFDKKCISDWNLAQQLSGTYETRISKFENTIMYNFKNVRERVFDIAGHIDEIDELSNAIIDVVTDIEDYDID